MPQSRMSSTAEQKALTAQQLSAFSRFNLEGAKTDLELLLTQIGRDGIFREYTKHDISHIDTLLGMLDWVVIPEAAEHMTPADWMLIVLSIYFHDAGLIVTQSEFDQRDSTEFPSFKKAILESPDPSSYVERVKSMEPAQRERFLYQEFVRSRHAERIRRWINGEAYSHLRASRETATEVLKIVQGLDENFRSDLALVCESHHKDDLGKLDIYNPRRAYGNDLRETVNLQFGAILLRTVDLLHVTRDRAPSLAFRLITPSDPKSIEEWHKQMPVVAVRFSPPRGDKGVVDKNAVPDTIEVTATFHDPLGFFSLTEYLFYAEQQLRLSNQWAEQTIAQEALHYKFPWRRIDSSQVRAVGFESRQFSFELDKPRILKLLTGHTLYSNSNVVVRELVQNSLDATRLQSRISGTPGSISLSLDTSTRTLTIDDNGTGMTQQIIENHFLNVGSSRYSDETFRKENPDFSAISRFGIGILSIFMISDEIEVVTKAATELHARNISIRSLNGKYLISLLDPNDSKVPALLKKHGTRVQLKLRPGVPIPPLAEIAEYWILFPGCDVTVKVDDGTPLSVGYKSPKQALERALTDAGYSLSVETPEGSAAAYRVVEETKEGLTLAYALRWTPMFKVWEFGFADILRRGLGASDTLPITAVCVHGIRVESTTPGFVSQSILAVSNMTGPRSPATNVARSNLEPGSLVDEMYGKVYEVYAQYISREISQMNQFRGFSISAATNEGRYLAAALQHPLPLVQCPTAQKLLFAQLKTVPWLTLDAGGQRSSVSISKLDKREGFWTVESSTYNSAEEFLKKMPTGISLGKLISLSSESDIFPEGSIVGGYAHNTTVRELLLAEFEVNEIKLQKERNQAFLHWRALAGRPIWQKVVPSDLQVRQRAYQLLNNFGRTSAVRFQSLVIQQSDELRLSGAGGECGLRGATQSFIFAGNAMHKFLADSLRAIESGQSDSGNYAFVILASNMLLSDEVAGDPNRVKVLEATAEQISQMSGNQVDISNQLREVIASGAYRMFDPMRGERPYSQPFSVRGLID